MGQTDTLKGTESTSYHQISLAKVNNSTWLLKQFSYPNLNWSRHNLFSIWGRFPGPGPTLPSPSQLPLLSTPQLTFGEFHREFNLCWIAKSKYANQLPISKCPIMKTLFLNHCLSPTSWTTSLSALALYRAVHLKNLRMTLKPEESTVLRMAFQRSYFLSYSTWGGW